ncbi:stage II sporulation protein P [Psychrobacillus sp.]|uniref:stage II sporulation protein P n=1 Tax=Psychrobacillus sp. TaxID=1871623 RepID=UPI0028BD3E8A|nr:stage II sporulation protein P [Psychrobacillus sp.]
MTNSMKHLTSLLLLLFLAPIIIATVQTPLLSSESDEPKNEDTPLVYAAQLETKPEIAEIVEPKKAFVYFTHSHEAYPPILAAKGAKVDVYDSENNITSFQDQISSQFAFHQVETEFLAERNPGVMDNYSTIKPFVQAAIANNEYDIILDLHRDTVKADISTLQSGGESYAKLLFVIGTEHDNYKWNEQLANDLSDQLNKIVPGISRGVLIKSRKDGNGVYNQDIAKNLLVVELGGVENTEQELNRSIAILAKAVSNLFNQQIPS